MSRVRKPSALRYRATSPEHCVSRVWPLSSSRCGSSCRTLNWSDMIVSGCFTRATTTTRTLRTTEGINILLLAFYLHYWQLVSTSQPSTSRSKPQRGDSCQILLQWRQDDLARCFWICSSDDQTPPKKMDKWKDRDSQTCLSRNMVWLIEYFITF